MHTHILSSLYSNEWGNYWTITQMHACTVLPLSNRIWIIHPSDTSIFPSRNKGTAITMTFKIITCPRNRVRTQNDRCGIIVSIIHDVDDTATIREPSREEESRREVWEVCFFGEWWTGGTWEIYRSPSPPFTWKSPDFGWRIITRRNGGGTLPCLLRSSSRSWASVSREGIYTSLGEISRWVEEVFFVINLFNL